MKNGVMDIKNHKWFSGDWDWDELANKLVEPSYVPEIAGRSDTSNFAEYPDSPNEPDDVPEDEDPFLNW